MKSHSFACKWKQGLCITLTFNLFVIPDVVIQAQCRSNKHFIKNLESNPLRVSYKASTTFMVFPYETSREERTCSDLVIWQFNCPPLPVIRHWHLWGALLSAEAGGVRKNGSCSSSASPLPGKQTGLGSLGSLYASPSPTAGLGSWRERVLGDSLTLLLVRVRDSLMPILILEGRVVHLGAKLCLVLVWGGATRLSPVVHLLRY